MNQQPVPAATVGVPDLSESLGHWTRYVAMTRFWLERSRTIELPLAEKMVLFWHGYLCSSLVKVGDLQLMFDQNQLFRTKGLGNFRTLLKEVSVQPAMLIYLDNERNKVGRPNENFARELMELFTLGVGNYSEADVRESARAWTGHGLDSNGHYVFDNAKHDNGQKTFFGTTKNWDGPGIIDHLLDGPKRDLVARFVATKVFSFFGHPNPAASTVQALANTFIASGWEISALVKAVFMHDEFRLPVARNGLLRSPFEIVVAGLRHSGLTAAEVSPEWQLDPLGQTAFKPPNVAGWKQNEYWMTSSATWAKAQYASTIRWRSYNKGTFETVGQLSASDAARHALDFFGIYAPSAKTLEVVQQLVQADRAQGSSGSWSERAGLLFVPMMTPEFQLA